MRTATMTALALILTSFTPAQAQTRRATSPAMAKASVDPAVCAGLMKDYEEASKKLALNKAEESLDDSAPRATMREAQNNTIINEARLTMEVMKNNGCTLPTRAPSANGYGLASLGCATALQKQRADAALMRFGGAAPVRPRPRECDMDTWLTDAQARQP